MAVIPALFYPGSTGRQPQLVACHGSRMFSALMPILFILLAFALRLTYNVAFAEHRICHIGDGYLFLTTGHKLMTLVKKSHSIGEVVGALQAKADDTDKGVLSDSLSQRLLLDGPVFPGYLAVVESILSVPDKNPHYERYAVPISLANSLVDSLTCMLIFVLGRTALGACAGAIAALLYATYPPAIINTATCFNEPFAAFLLILWTLALFRIMKGETFGILRTGLFLAFGLETALLVLAKPAFVVIPPVVLGLALIIGGRPRGAQLWGSALAFLLGAGTILLPWGAFSTWQTGKFSLMVNRVPAYNFCTGNQLSSDGWASYKSPLAVNDMSKALETVGKEVGSHPFEFAGLYLRKVGRLWGGVWNDFSYSFLIRAKAQEILHQMILILSLSGFLLAIGRCQANQGRSVAHFALVSAGIVLLHFSYLAFVPMPRYAMTALPLIFAFAGFAVSQISFGPARRRILILLAGSLAFLTVKASMPNLVPCLLPVVGSVRLALWANALVWAIGGVLIGLLTLFAVVHVVERKRLVASMVLASYVLLGGVLAASSLADSNATEWCAPLSGGHERIVQTIKLPAARWRPSAPSFIVLDAWAPDMTPDLTVRVNGFVVDQAIVPWYQDNSQAKDIVAAMRIQADAAGMPVQALRQWWAIPVSPALFHTSRINTLEFSAAKPGQVVFGDYVPEGPASHTRHLPSFQDFSWMKGFTTSERGDGRIWQEMPVLGTVRGWWQDGDRVCAGDLSRVPGIQSGEFRIRLVQLPAGLSAVPPTMLAHARTRIFSREGEMTIAGANPYSFFVTPQAVPLATLPQGRLVVSCDLRANHDRSTSYVAVEISGIDKEGVRQAWQGLWQPNCINCGKSWQSVSFSERVPDCVRQWTQLKLTVTASPFHSDLIFLQRTKATRRKLRLKNLKIELERDWGLGHCGSPVVF